MFLIFACAYFSCFSSKSTSTIIVLKIFTSQYGLSGVWVSYIVFNLIRLLFVYVHQQHFGPFSSDDNKYDDNDDNKKVI